MNKYTKIFLEMPHIGTNILDPYTNDVITQEDMRLEYASPDIRQKISKLVLKNKPYPIYSPYSKKVFLFDPVNHKSFKVKQDKYAFHFSTKVRNTINKDFKK